jgi:2-succinyl-5-enolpyruvyl-6-hydroxy-3-cyclohexene-1-carboxylate synthase
MISDKKPVQDFVSLLTAHGITHVIITPGSRNAPFSISLLEYPGISSHSIVDERSAGFVALGMAQQIGKPVVLICTSGTAALNFAPAIAEAYYQRVPLLIVTADRPIEWIDQGEGQSIRQKDLHKNYVKASYEIAEEAQDGDLVWYNVRVMDEAMRLCTEGVPGPVHINFPLRESLYKTVESHDTSVKMIRSAATEISIQPDELKVNQTKIVRRTKDHRAGGSIA